MTWLWPSAWNFSFEVTGVDVADGLFMGQEGVKADALIMCCCWVDVVDRRVSVAKNNCRELLVFGSVRLLLPIVAVAVLLAGIVICFCPKQESEWDNSLQEEDKQNQSKIEFQRRTKIKIRCNAWILNLWRRRQMVNGSGLACYVVLNCEALS